MKPPPLKNLDRLEKFWLWLDFKTDLSMAFVHGIDSIIESNKKRLNGKEFKQQYYYGKSLKKIDESVWFIVLKQTTSARTASMYLMPMNKDLLYHLVWFIGT